jgi:hypothetical protein
MIIPVFIGILISILTSIRRLCIYLIHFRQSLLFIWYLSSCFLLTGILIFQQESFKFLVNLLLRQFETPHYLLHGHSGHSIIPFHHQIKDFFRINKLGIILLPLTNYYSCLLPFGLFLLYNNLLFDYFWLRHRWYRYPHFKWLCLLHGHVVILLRKLWLNIRENSVLWNHKWLWILHWPELSDNGLVNSLIQNRLGGGGLPEEVWRRCNPRMLAVR